MGGLFDLADGITAGALRLGIAHDDYVARVGGLIILRLRP